MLCRQLRQVRDHRRADAYLHGDTRVQDQAVRARIDLSNPQSEKGSEAITDRQLCRVPEPRSHLLRKLMEVREIRIKAHILEIDLL